MPFLKIHVSVVPSLGEASIRLGSKARPLISHCPVVRDRLNTNVRVTADVASSFGSARSFDGIELVSVRSRVTRNCISWRERAVGGDVLEDDLLAELPGEVDDDVDALGRRDRRSGCA